MDIGKRKGFDSLIRNVDYAITYGGTPREVAFANEIQRIRHLVLQVRLLMCDEDINHDWIISLLEQAIGMDAKHKYGEQGDE